MVTGRQQEAGRAVTARVRRLWFMALLAAGVLGGAVYFLFLPPRPPERVILVIVDMLRADYLSSYGGKAKTSRLDRLAADGMRIPHAVASYHQTTMSMASIFTGQTPSLETDDVRTPLDWNGKTWCGMSRFAGGADDQCIPQRLNTLAETMQRHGYWTIGVAANPLTFDPSGFSQGFDDWRQLETADGPEAGAEMARQRGARRVNELALRTVDARPRDRFFLYVHYMDVHDYGLHGRTYAQSVEATDRAIGRLLDELQSRGLLGNALVVVTSDHGERLGEQHALPGMGMHLGNPSFETVLRVPLIVWPTQRLTLPAVVRGQDTRFLIEEIVGVHSDQPREIDGEEVLLTERRYLTYRRYPYKAMWRRQDDQLFLFNLDEDPGELSNVAAAQPELAARQRDRMSTLAAALVSRPPSDSVLTESDKERLRALGYAD